jgi:hyaluronan synthase
LLAAGYDTVIELRARAFTAVPDNLYWYARQQLRWNRTFIRELPLAARVVAERPAYIAFDLAYQVVAPLLGVAVALLCAGQASVLGVASLADDLLLIAVTLLVAAAFRAAQARDFQYLLYMAVYLSIVFPGWLIALATPARNGWKTRDLPP